MRKFTQLAVIASSLAAVSAVAVPATAQTFGQKGDIAFAGERLMGIYFLTQGGAGATDIGLAATNPASPYSIARLGVDGFIIDRLSLGGSVFFTDIDPKHGRSSTGGLFSPRVGYTIPISDSFGFWPRGGFTYWSFGNANEFGLTFEAMFYATPVQHFAFTFGPLLDLGFAGSSNNVAANFGLLTVGVMGWL